MRIVHWWYTTLNVRSVNYVFRLHCGTPLALEGRSIPSLCGEPRADTYETISVEQVTPNKRDITCLGCLVAASSSTTRR